MRCEIDYCGKIITFKTENIVLIKKGYNFSDNDFYFTICFTNGLTETFNYTAIDLRDEVYNRVMEDWHSDEVDAAEILF